MGGGGGGVRAVLEDTQIKDAFFGGKLPYTKAVHRTPLATPGPFII